MENVSITSQWPIIFMRFLCRSLFKGKIRTSCAVDVSELAPLRHQSQLSMSTSVSRGSMFLSRTKELCLECLDNLIQRYLF